MLFFERELEVYVSSVDTGFTADNTVKLAILAGSSIDYDIKKENTYNYKIESSPDRVGSKVNLGYTNPVFKFKTYAKPILDGGNTTAVEHLLLYSLTGTVGTETASTYTTSFATTHKLPELYFYIKLDTIIYKISNAIVKSAAFKIDIKDLLTISWNTVGLNLEKVDSVPDTFSDYSNSTKYLKGVHAYVGMTLEQALSGYTANVFLDASDFQQKGTETGITVTNYGATLQTIGGQPCYQVATTRNTNRIELAGAMPFTGNAQPDTGTGSWTFECAIYRYELGEYYAGNIFSLIGDTNNRLYQQGPSLFGYFFGGHQLYWHYNNYSMPVDTVLPINTWTHIAVSANAVTNYIVLYVNGRPFGISYMPAMNDTGVATTGVFIGGTINSNSSFESGYIAYPELTYGDANPKYISKYSPPYAPAVDANHVVYIGESFSDDTTNGHSVTPVNYEDLGTYFRTGPSNVYSNIQVGRSALWDASGDWSIEIRVNLYSTATYVTAGDIFNDGVRRIRVINNEIWCYVNGSLLMVDNECDDGANIKAMPKNTWHYLAFERYNGNYYLYLNGNLRMMDNRGTIIPNTVPSTGTANLMEVTKASNRYWHFQYFRLSNIARYSQDMFFTAPDYVTELVGEVPIVSGTLKLANDLQIVERNTLDNRLTTKLDHYVKSRTCQLDLSAYLRTGTVSNNTLFDKIKEDIDIFQDSKLTIQTKLGRSDNGGLTVTMPKAYAELPEIKMKDVISSNMKFYSGTDQTLGDDLEIEYTTTPYVPNIYTPTGKPNLLLDDDYISTIYADGAKHIYPMQEPSGTILYDIVNGNNGVITNYTDNLLYEQAGKPVGAASMAPNSMLQNNNNAYAVCSVPLSTYIAANGGVSIEVWWKLTSFNSSNPQIFGIGDTSTAANATVYMRRDGAGSNLEICSGNSSTNSPTYIPSTGTWYHLVITSDEANSHKFYVNGVLKLTATWGIASFANEVTFLGARDRGDTNNMIQHQSHGAVYDRILTSTEILAHYNKG